MGGKTEQQLMDQLTQICDHTVYWKTVAGSPGFDPEAWRNAIAELFRSG